MYLKITNGVPNLYTLKQLQNDNPEVSFPTDLTNEVLAEYAVYPCVRGPVPTYDSLIETLAEGSFTQDEGGNWVLPYVAVQLSLERAEANVRIRRNNLLQETDWMALSDNTLSPEWATYRQELRDLTSQVGFPYNTIWPVRPGGN